MVGSNCTPRLVICPGVNVDRRMGPASENPAPVTVAEMMVTDAVPVDVKVTVWVAIVFSATLPNPTLVALMPSVGVPRLTVNITVCVAVV